MQKPSACRTVLYCFYDRFKKALIERPAIITSVDALAGTVNLTVFFEAEDSDSRARGNSGDRDFDPRYEAVLENRTEMPQSDMWRWPPRV